jgi:hypothetical protein
MDARTRARLDHFEDDARPVRRVRPDADGVTAMFVLSNRAGTPVAAFPNRAAMRTWLDSRGAGAGLLYSAILVPIG